MFRIMIFMQVLKYFYYILINYFQLYSDALIRYGHDMTSKLASKLSDQPVYSYQFEYQGRYSHWYMPGTQKPYGKLK